MLVKAQFLRVDTQTDEPFHPLLAPELEPLRVRPRLDEELHLHLLELPGPEDEVPPRDLGAERLPDLGDAERDLLPGRLQHVEIVDVDPLPRLGTQVHLCCRLLDPTYAPLDPE